MGPHLREVGGMAVSEPAPAAADGNGIAPGRLLVEHSIGDVP
jgi:hypothetical protein